MSPRDHERPWTSFERKVTIFIGTKKHEATQMRYWRGAKHPYRDAFHVEFKPKRARYARAFADHKGLTVVLDGWNHPEFDWLLRSLAEAPSVELSPGVSIKETSYTILPGQQPEKNKYELEFEEYLGKLDRSRILLDTRGAFETRQ